MGPNSYIWEAFVDPETLLSTYSIALARPNIFGTNGASDIKSNLTFGGADAEWYADKESIYMTALSNYSYGVENFGFGKVYQENGVDSSEFFYELGNSHPVTFNTNFKGIGLPASIYSQFVTLLEYVTNGAVECASTTDGLCTLPGPCSNYTGLTDFSFKVNYTNNIGNNYMRIPLEVFAYKVLVSGGSFCNIEVQYLDTDATQSQDIILGGMYYQEFFGVFQNDYHSKASPDQATRQYVGRNSIYPSYIGNESLPTGVNPFIPVPPSPPAESGLGTVWIVVIALIGAALLGFLGFLLYKYKMAQAQAQKVRGSNVVYGTDGNVNASNTTGQNET